jgi:hypothetical protein
MGVMYKGVAGLPTFGGRIEKKKKKKKKKKKSEKSLGLGGAPKALCGSAGSYVRRVGNGAAHHFPKLASSKRLHSLN